MLNKTFLKQLCKSIKAYKLEEISHGDLSEYNILNVREKPYIIDVGQAVPKSHPLHHELHKRDMSNTFRFWKKYIKNLNEEELKKLDEINQFIMSIEKKYEIA